MCGIIGYIAKKEIDFKKNWSKNLQPIKHRGPDDSGFFIDNNVFLGHVRLSILDLSIHGKQPFLTPSERFVISYNGEVYNFQDIADKYHIEDRLSGTDTEIIVRAFEKVGVSLFSELNGMFSLAIFDKHEKKLWLASDRFGIKSVFYKKSENFLTFSSEIKGLEFSTERDNLKLNWSALHEWLYFGCTFGKNTVLDEVERLLPGHYLEIDINSYIIKDVAYWSLDTTKMDVLKQEKYPALIQKTKLLLENAVSRQLVSDVPVGVLLSGGIDSGAITAFASKHYGKKLQTYSAAFDFNQTENEFENARIVAEKFGTEHHEIFISGTDLADIVEKMVYHHDSPFSDAANIPIYLICNEIKKETKVVLQGDGGDELFGGYQRYKTLFHFKKMQYLMRFLGFFSVFMVKNANYFRINRYKNALLANNELQTIVSLLTVEDVNDPPTAVFLEKYKKLIEKTDPFSRYREKLEQFGDISIVDKLFFIDHSITLPDLFLEKVDKSSMAASVEVRVPFLDNDLVDFCLSLSYKQKLGPGKQKWLLKKALEGILPEKILYGKKKGFGVPYGHWIKGPLFNLFQDHLQTFETFNPSVLDRKKIDQMFCLYKNGSRDYSFLLWKCLNLVIWANQKRIVFHDK